MNLNKSEDIFALTAVDADSWAALIISLLEVLAGTVTSSFILFDVLRNVFKGQSLSTKDKILLALSISNVASPIILFIYIVSDILWLSLDEILYIFFYSLILYCMSSSSWLTLCLCFFYFIRIMGFRSGYLSMMKKNMDVLVPWTILVVELVSLLTSFMNFTLEVLSIDTSSSINTTNGHLSPAKFFEVMYVSNFASYPLIIVTTGCIMASVTIHIHRMKRNISGTMSLVAHHRVVRTMKHLVAFYVLFYVLLLIEFKELFPYIWSGCTYLIILLTLSPVQSLIIIHGNTRLHKSWKQMWQCPGLRTLFW
ncbi:hypothetical protein GDO81_019916 [Engystomops pustulosus]|uniref:Taste receptor type 2 n=1 Tax=Engystomops pustulosus TaxID=76066 RepID=A0AAV6ZAI5_ENGPU|nr:hypothetical protein GDO81_019916 [Engystomops pustulosus]